MGNLETVRAPETGKIVEPGIVVEVGRKPIQPWSAGIVDDEIARRGGNGSPSRARETGANRPAVSASETPSPDSILSSAARSGSSEDRPTRSAKTSGTLCNAPPSFPHLPTGWARQAVCRIDRRRSSAYPGQSRTVPYPSARQSVAAGTAGIGGRDHRRRQAMAARWSSERRRTASRRTLVRQMGLSTVAAGARPDPDGELTRSWCKGSATITKRSGPVAVPGDRGLCGSASCKAKCLRPRPGIYRGFSCFRTTPRFCQRQRRSDADHSGSCRPGIAPLTGVVRCPA